MNNNTILAADNLSIGIKKKICIVQNITFNLFEHEFLAIIGPNGCGKTSFINTLIGQLDIIKGNLFFLGKEHHHYHHKERARYVALMGQNISVDPRMNVHDYIALGRFPHFHYCTRHYDNQCIKNTIEKLAIGHLLARKIGHLSGGEFQRINLARVLVQEPKLLLLDEPTNHLDPVARVTLLKHIKEQKITTIAVLHDLSLVEYFADKVVIINQGKMARYGDINTCLNPYWMKQTFGLHTIEFTHPNSKKTIRVFDIPEEKMSDELY